MSVFADSSAVVKRYSDEDGSGVVRGLGVLVVSQLARVEVPSAIWRKSRLGELSMSDARVLCDAFEADLLETSGPDALIATSLTPAVLDDAARACAVHALKAYEAVQLASAMTVRATDPSCRAFAVFDAALRRAAATEGFILVPPDGPP